MEQEILQQWLEDTLQSSANMEYDIFQQELDDTFGWGELLEMMWYELKKPCAGGVLLTGPDGCGKHTAAAHMVQLAVKKNSFGTVFLDGLDFCGEGFAWLRDRLNGLLDQFYDRNQGLCLVLENLETLPWRRELMTFLGRTLGDYRRGSGNPEASAFPSLFLVLLDRQEEDIPAVLRGKMRLCRMSLPNRTRRERFLKKFGASFQSFVSMDQLAQATEGATYAQLMAIVENVANLVSCREEQLPEEELQRFLEEQMPLREKDQLAVLTEAVRDLLAQLPKLVKGAGVNIDSKRHEPEKQVMPVLENPISPLNDGDYLNKRQKEVENMAVKSLMLDLFGEEGVADFMNVTVTA